MRIFKKWKPEVNADSLPEATLPPSPVEDEDTYEAIVVACILTAFSNEEPSLFDEEEPLSLPRVAEPSDAGTPGEETAVPITVARKVTHRSHVDERWGID